MVQCPWKFNDKWKPTKDNDAIRCGKAKLPPRKIWTFKREHGVISSIVSNNDEKIHRFKEMLYLGSILKIKSKI